MQNVTIGGRLIRGLLSSSVLCASVVVVTAVALGAITWQEQRQGASLATGLTDQFALSVASAEALNELTASALWIVTRDLVVLSGKGLGLLLLLVWASDIAQAGLLSAFQYVLRTSLVGESHPLDAAASAKLLRLGVVSIVLVGGVALAVPTDGFELDELPAVLFAITGSFVALAIAGLWWFWRGQHALGSGARLAIVEYLTAPFRKLRLWIAGMSLTLVAYVAIGMLIPWFVGEARDLPSRVRPRLEVLLSDTSIQERRSAAIRSLRLSLPPVADEHDARAFARAVAVIHTRTSEWARVREEDARDWTPDRLAAVAADLTRLIAVVFAFAFIGVVLAPHLVLKGSMRRTAVVTAGSLLPLPTLFVLDRMGVTSAVPWVFFAVYAPLALGDAIVSSRTSGLQVPGYWVIGRSKIHSTRTCPALAGVPDARVVSGEAGPLLRAGFVSCRKCRARTPKGEALELGG